MGVILDKVETWEITAEEATNFFREIIENGANLNKEELVKKFN